MSFLASILPFIVLFIGVALVVFVIDLYRLVRAQRAAARFIRKNNYTSGIFVRQGMVIDPETGLVRGTVVPSDKAIELFL